MRLPQRNSPITPTLPAIARVGVSPSKIRPSGCNVGKRIACIAGGLAAATVACGGGTFLATPSCVLAIDQLAGLGCCDCLPKGKIREFCKDL